MGRAAGRGAEDPQAGPAVLGSVREPLPGSSLYGFEELAPPLEAWLGGVLSVLRLMKGVSGAAGLFVRGLSEGEKRLHPCMRGGRSGSMRLGG